MRIAIIEKGHREYLLNTFVRHPDFAAEIVCFAEWKPMAQWHQGIPIIPLSQLKEQGCDIVLIAVSHNHRLSRLLAYLHDRGIENLHVIRLFALDTHADFIVNGTLDLSCVDRLSEKAEKPYLVHLETHVCDQCNLNCKACNNFSPFVTGRKVADLAQFHADLQKLQELFSNIGRFFLLGGEPLLEPEHCCEMIKIARRCFPNTELRVLTNALLIQKMSPGFWDCLRENDVIVHISVYPPVLGRLGEIEATLRAYGVKYLLARKVEKFGKRLTLYPFEDAKHNNNVCGSAGCHYLQDGRIAKCPDGILVGNMAPALGCVPEALQDSKTINITEENDGWDVIRQLNAPCDLCKRCTHQRLEAIIWEPVKNVPEPADWLVENRLEYENGKLSEQLQNMAQKKESAEAELGDVKEELRRTGQSVKELEVRLHEKELALSMVEQNVVHLEKVAADGELNLKAKLAELQNAQEEARRWRTKFEQTNRYLRDRERQLHALDKEYHAVLSSLSFRLGRVLTWLPRKVRGGVRCLREHGLSYTIKQYFKKAADKVLPESLTKFNKLFRDNILTGYHIYHKLILQYGDDAAILGCAPLGTGDYYFCGMYLNEWLKKRNVANYVFLTTHGSPKAVTELFPVYEGHTVELDAMDLRQMRSFYGFMGPGGSNYSFLDHQITAPKSITFPMMGHNNLTILDFYRYFGFDLPESAHKDTPIFEKNAAKIRALLLENDLLPQKTIMLSPYTSSNQNFAPGMKFWERLVEHFRDLGFCVCTNCAGKEKPINGTVGLCVSYKEIVPFLDQAGIFVGMRSGLCDMIATSSCKKIVIHTYRNRFWPDGNSIAYTGVKTMGLCDDAVEIEYSEDRKDQILKSVVEAVLENNAENSALCDGSDLEVRER